MSGPVIVTIRPGVQFDPAAAGSFQRAEHDWHSRTGRLIDVNSTYREWDRQMSMHLAWQAWTTGRGPKPPHSRAVHPKYSRHCTGIALDSDDWTTPGFNTLMAEHGWIRVAADDPTERHHFEYQPSRDQHINDPIPATTPTQEDEMTVSFINIAGKAGARRGGCYAIMRGNDGKLFARHVGAPLDSAPTATDERAISDLQASIPGLA